MAITEAICTSFKADLLLGVHSFRVDGGTGADTFKMALYTSSATINANTTAYSATNEVSDANYTAGGGTLAMLGVTATNTSTSAGTGWIDITDETWSSVSITARGALIYNTTPSANNAANALVANASVAVLDFGADKTATSGDFTVVFPAGAASTAILRIA